MKINSIGFYQNKTFKTRYNTNKTNPIALSPISFHGNFATAQEIKEYIKEHPSEDLKQIAQHFETSVSYIKALLDIKPPKKKYASLPVTRENTLAYLRKHKNANIEELAQYFNVSTTYMNSFLKKFNFTESELNSTIRKSVKDYIKAHPEANQSQIADYFNLSRAYTSHIIDIGGIEYTKKYSRQGNVAKEELEEYISNHPEENLAQIAEYFGVSKVYIGNLVKKYKIDYIYKKELQISPEELENYVKTHPKANLEEIAKHFNIPIQSASVLIKRYNIEYDNKHRAPIISKEDLENYIAQHPDESKARIAKYFNVAQTCISGLIRKYNIPYKRKSKPI